MTKISPYFLPLLTLFKWLHLAMFVLFFKISPDSLSSVTYMITEDCFYLMIYTLISKTFLQNAFITVFQ